MFRKTFCLKGLRFKATFFDQIVKRLNNSVGYLKLIHFLRARKDSKSDLIFN